MLVCSNVCDPNQVIDINSPPCTQAINYSNLWYYSSHEHTSVQILLKLLVSTENVLCSNFRVVIENKWLPTHDHFYNGKKWIASFTAYRTVQAGRVDF